MTGITSADPSLVDANVVAQRYDQLLKQFHGNAEQAMMALQRLQGPTGMVPLSELFFKFQNLKKQQQKPVDPNTINAQLSQMAGLADQGVAALPAHNVGGPNAYAGGGIVSFSGGGPSNINPMSTGGLDLEALDLELTKAGYDPDSKAEMLRRAAAQRARTMPGGASSVTRSPYAVDSTEEILKRAATQRTPVAAGEVAAPAAAEGAGAAGAEAAPGMMSRLGGMARNLLGRAGGLGLYALIHSPDTVAQDQEMAAIQKYRAAQGLPGVYATGAPAANTPPPAPVETAPAKPAGASGTQRTSISTPRMLDIPMEDTFKFEDYLKDKAEEVNPAKKGFSAYVKEQLDMLGPNKGLEDYKKHVDGLEGIAKFNAQNDLRMAKAAAFFNMAVAAGRPGQAGSSLSKFLNSAAEGGMSYAQAEPRIRQGLASVQQKIAEDKFRLADAERKERADAISNARREYGADQRTYASMIGDITKFQIGERAATVRAQVAELNATARANMQYKLIADQTAKLDAAAARTALTDASRGAMDKSKQLLAALSNPMIMNNPTAYQQIQQEYADAIAYEHAINTRLAEVGGIIMPKPSIGANSVAEEMKRRGLIK